MADATTANNPTGDRTLITETETFSTSFSPLNIHRYDSQIDLNSYYINYIDDPSVQLDLITLENKTSTSVIDENSCRVVVTQLPEEVTKF